MKVKLDAGARMPTKAHREDAGYDLYSRDRRIIPAGASAVFDTGVHIAFPKGTAGLIVSKSGLNCKHSLTSTGLVDCGYTGSIRVKLYNNGLDPYLVEVGDKISQIVPIKIADFELQEVNGLEMTDRGCNGFGSSGR